MTSITNRTLIALLKKPLSNGQLRHAVGTSWDAEKYRRLVLQSLMNDSKIYSNNSTYELSPSGEQLAHQIQATEPQSKPTKTGYTGIQFPPTRAGSQDFLQVRSIGFPT